MVALSANMAGPEPLHLGESEWALVREEALDEGEVDLLEFLVSLVTERGLSSLQNCGAECCLKRGFLWVWACSLP